MTDRFKPNEPQYQNALTVNLPISTNDTAELRFAATGLQREWQLKSVFRSPRFTFQWNELLVVG